MYPRTHLLGLPRELRDEIYKAYVEVDGGYLYNYQSGKMTQANGQPISLALMHTCRLVAEEMSGLALGCNAITFRTIDSKELHLGATRLASVLEQLLADDSSALLNADGITDDYVRQSTSEYPQFRDMLTLLQAGADAAAILDRFSPAAHLACGETPSLYRAFLRHAAKLQLDPNDTSPRSGWRRACLSLDVVPWKIRTPAETGQMAQVLRSDPENYRGYTLDTDGDFYRFSAAAASIHFLEMTSEAVRKQLRRIILIEDRPSVAYPECHAQGLIPFCREYPLLRVERRANLWRNLFVGSIWPGLETMTYRYGIEIMSDMDASTTAIGTDRIIYPIALWMVEAHALESLGMPPDSFKLVLDGEPTEWHATTLFEVVHKYAAWQTAFDEACKRIPNLKPSHFERRKHGCYLFEVFPRILEDLVAGKGATRCNFDPGQPHDCEQILDEYRHWSANDWMHAVPQVEPSQYGTMPPLPSFPDILGPTYEAHIENYDLR